MKMTSSGLLSALTIFTLFPTVALANSGDFSGGVAIGTGYAGIYTAPTNSLIVQGSAGVGSTSPVTSLDLSQKTDAIALPVGSSSTRPTGAALTNGEIRYNTSTPGVEAYVNGAWTSLNGGSGSSQWTTSGSNIYYNTGNVGIGTSAPADQLDVYSGGIHIGSGTPVGTSNALYAVGSQLYWNGAQQRTRLTANTSYYVSTTGNDSNPGTSALPWLTLQNAINYVWNNLDLNGFLVTINVADGTYTTGFKASGPFVGAGTVQITGDTTTPANCIISTTGVDDIEAVNGAVISVQGFELKTTTSGSGIDAFNGGIINVDGNMNYGPIANVQILVQQNSSVVTITANYTISGGAQFHEGEEFGGSIFDNNTSITLTGTPAFTGAYAYADGPGYLSIATNTFTGSATGLRYNAILNGIIFTNAGGATYLPGNSAGATSTGGQYF